MNATAKHAQSPTLTGEISPEAVVQEVTALYAELHRGEAAPQTVSLSSHLERDLGLDSLGRVELGLRLEVRFGVHLLDAAIGSAETVADLLGVLTLRYGRHRRSYGRRHRTSNCRASSSTRHAQDGDDAERGTGVARRTTSQSHSRDRPR